MVPLKVDYRWGPKIDASSLRSKLLPACDIDAPNLAATAALTYERHSGPSYRGRNEYTQPER